MAEELTKETNQEIPSIELNQEAPAPKTKEDFIAEELANVEAAKAAINENFAKLYQDNATIFQVGNDILEKLHCPTIVNVTSKNEGVLRNYLDETSGLVVAQALFDRGLEDPRVAYYSNAKSNLAIRDHQVVVEREGKDGEPIKTYKDAPILLKSGSKGMSISKVPLITRDYKYSPKDPEKTGADIRKLEEHCFTLVPVFALDTNAFEKPFEIDPGEDFSAYALQQDMDTIFRAAVKKTAEILEKAKAEGREITNFWEEMCNGFEAARQDINEMRHQRENFLISVNTDRPYTDEDDRIQQTLAKAFKDAVKDADENNHDISKHYAIDAVRKLFSNPNYKTPEEKISEVMQQYAPGAVNNTNYGQWVVKQAKKEMAISRAIHKKERAEKEKAAAVR